MFLILNNIQQVNDLIVVCTCYELIIVITVFTILHNILSVDIFRFIYTYILLKVFV